MTSPNEAPSGPSAGRRLVVVASRNAGKVRELELLFALPGLELAPMSALLPDDFEVEETGSTFEDNAWLKALSVARATGHPALADDSGIEVDALGGRPGVYSARYAGARATDDDNNQLLLRELEDVPDERRTARFRSVLVLASPGSPDVQRVSSASGAVEGRILRAPRGAGGFGYDPLFATDELGGRTTAEASLAEKNRISHRGRAARALAPALARFMERVEAGFPV